MFESLKEYFAQRRIEREEAAYRDGFEWAMGEYYIAKASLNEIEAMAAVDHYDPFDFGVNEALRNLKIMRDAISPERITTGKISILYRMARLLRNTDGLHPSTAGPTAGQLLGELRRLDCGRYDREVM